jgi:Putative Actinobacterial Holin-X, holin superfamily III
VLLHEKPGHDRPETGRSIFALVEELLRNTAKLLDQKLMLLRLEVEDSLGTLIRHLAVLLIGGALAGLGLVLSSIALALWIGSQVGSIIAGYALTGAGFLLAGAVLVAVRLSRGVGPQRPLAGRTLKELEKDTRWLKSER